jgi:hypothetical protein
MEKIYKVGLVFDFDPSGEHDFLFDEGMTEEQMILEMRRMVTNDVMVLSDSGDLYRQLDVWTIDK